MRFEEEQIKLEKAKVELELKREEEEQKGIEESLNCTEKKSTSGSVGQNCKHSEIPPASWNGGVQFPVRLWWKF